MSYEQTFELKTEHIALLQNASLRWEDCEFGAPSIDCKRPYGNTSVYIDMCEILELDESSVDKDYLRKLHEETLTALQIFLEFGNMVEGTYKAKEYGRGWVKVK
jgi:hypothetical protein